MTTTPKLLPHTPTMQPHGPTLELVRDLCVALLRHGMADHSAWVGVPSPKTDVTRIGKLADDLLRERTGSIDSQGEKSLDLERLGKELYELRDKEAAPAAEREKVRQSWKFKTANSVYRVDDMGEWYKLTRVGNLMQWDHPNVSVGEWFKAEPQKITVGKPFQFMGRGSGLTTPVVEVELIEAPGSSTEALASGGDAEQPTTEIPGRLNGENALSDTAKAGTPASSSTPPPEHGRLEPCEKCGEAQAHYKGRPGRGYTVICLSCGHEGDWGDYGYQARAAWNRRAPLTSPPASATPQPVLSGEVERVLRETRANADADENMDPTEQRELCDLIERQAAQAASLATIHALSHAWGDPKSAEAQAGKCLTVTRVRELIGMYQTAAAEVSVANNDKRILTDQLREEMDRKNKWLQRAETAEASLSTLQTRYTELEVERDALLRGALPLKKVLQEAVKRAVETGEPSTITVEAYRWRDLLAALPSDAEKG